MSIRIIFKEKDVRALSTKGDPSKLRQAGVQVACEVLHSEDVFDGLLSLGQFGMKLRGHKKYLREICKKVDQDLNSPTCRKLREHLSSCPFCSAYYDSMKETILLYRKYDEKLPGSRVKEILFHLETSEISEIPTKRKKRLKGK